MGMNDNFNIPIVKLTETEDRSKSNSHRIDKLEKNFEALNRLASSVEVLANEQKNMYKKIDSIDAKVTDLEKIPSKHWNNAIGYILASVISSITTWLITQ